MPRQTVIINQSQYQGSGVFSYRFPRAVHFENAKISLYSLAMYNSTYNITSTYNNNTFSITWINGTTYSATLPNGYYEYSDVNTYIQYFCLQNFLYVSSSTNQPVYFISVSQNLPLYAGQINVTTVPTASVASSEGYTLPAGATWSFPTTAKTPQITFSTGLGKIFGFSANLVFPPTVQPTPYAYTSDITPVISPVYSYLVSCNLLNSDLSLYNQLFFQVPINANFGGLINFTNPQSQMIDIQPGNYYNLNLYFYDQNYNPLNIKDTEVTIILLIDY